MSRIFRKLLTADAVGLILSWIAVYLLIYGISASLRQSDTQYFYYACTLSALIGLVLSRTKLNGIQASAWIAALGVSGVWVIGANLSIPLVALGKALFSLVKEIIPAIRSKTPLDTTPILETWSPIAQSSATLWARLQNWMSALFYKINVNDALIRNMVWLLVLWFIAAWVGWSTRKRNAILTLFPALALLSVVTSISEKNIGALWLMLVDLLLLMGVWSYRVHSYQWEKQKIDYSESIPFDVTQAVVFLSLLIAGLAFITPSISWRDIQEHWRDRNQTSKNETVEMLGIQQPASPQTKTVAQIPSLPREHLLTGGFANSEKVVMTIKTGELSPMPYEMGGVNVPRYYWRSVTYDTYVSSGWETSAAHPQAAQANTPLLPGLLSGYKLVHMDVDMVQPEGKLFWSGMLYSANVPLSVNWRFRPQSSLFADRSVLLQADIFAATVNTTRFKVDTYVPIVSAEEMRSASTEYPEDIARRYLILPSSVPDRVFDLAQQITKGIANPYDKVKAIESYLRTNYPYDLEIPAPPKDQDVADYFLFDLKRGYCDYYATAMVVLTRASGVPARFVSGYASGSYDALSAQYVVREMDAHSWVEVYFPEIGWVEFEPTASEPEIQRLQPDTLAANDNKERSSAQKLLIRFYVGKAVRWILPAGSLLFFTVFYFAFIEKWMLLRLVPSLAIERIYFRLYQQGRPLAGEYTRAETAYEFLNKLTGKIDELSKGSRFAKMFSTLQTEASTLTNLYHATLFIDQHIDKEDVHHAWHSWRRVYWRLFFARIVLFVKHKTIQMHQAQILDR
ncbi:MAG: transglutaminase-like domain-containing protein [Anaerolineales bacterium]